MTKRQGVGITVLAATAALLAGCSSPTGDAQDDLTSSGHWSVTQTITNNSATDLVVASVKADNGGQVAGYPTSIPANSPPVTFEATDTGNGVQMWITLTGPDGQNLVVDSDVPHTDPNWSTARLTGTTTGLSTGAISIGSGDNPTAAFTIDPCPQARCTTSSSTDGGPHLGGTAQ